MQEKAKFLWKSRRMVPQCAFPRGRKIRRFSHHPCPNLFLRIRYLSPNSTICVFSGQTPLQMKPDNQSRDRAVWRAVKFQWRQLKAKKAIYFPHSIFAAILLNSTSRYVGIGLEERSSEDENKSFWSRPSKPSDLSLQAPAVKFDLFNEKEAECEVIAFEWHSHDHE